MLQNARIAAFTVSELLRENQPPTQIRVNLSFLGTSLNIAALFFSILVDLAIYTISFAISLESLLVTRSFVSI